MRYSNDAIIFAGLIVPAILACILFILWLQSVFTTPAMPH